MRGYDRQTITPRLMGLRDPKRLKPPIFFMTAGQAEYFQQIFSITSRDSQSFRHSIQVVPIPLYRFAIALITILHLMLVKFLSLRAQEIFQSGLSRIETNETGSIRSFSIVGMCRSMRLD